MKIAVLSGKGGTGKTFISVNLATSAEKSVYLDCDVEEPNGHLFFKPNSIQRKPVYTFLPDFNTKKCTGCRKCIDFCRFHALVFIENAPFVFPEICHYCGGCKIICPNNAIEKTKRIVGVVEQGTHHSVSVVSGILNLGETSGIPVIQSVLNHTAPSHELTIIDCPPGSSCSVMESIKDADYCILVTEPTAFGLHNLKMVYKLTSLLKKPSGIIINKVENTHTLIDDFCRQYNVPILSDIPFSPKFAKLGAKAEIISEVDLEMHRFFLHILDKIKSEVMK